MDGRWGVQYDSSNYLWLLWLPKFKKNCTFGTHSTERLFLHTAIFLLYELFQLTRRPAAERAN